VNPGRRLRPDHGNRRELPALLAPPLRERLGDGPVELLIRRPHGLGQVEVDLPQRRRLHDGRRVAPGDQQHPPGGGIQLTHPREELRAGPGRHPLVSQDQRHIGAFAPELLQPGQRLLRRRAGHDPVIRPVSAFQLPRQRLAASVLGIDNHDHRSGHGDHPRPARPDVLLRGCGGRLRLWPAGGQSGRLPDPDRQQDHRRRKGQHVQDHYGPGGSPSSGLGDVARICQAGCGRGAHWSFACNIRPAGPIPARGGGRVLGWVPCSRSVVSPDPLLQ